MVQPTALGHWAGAYGACSHALLSWGESWGGPEGGPGLLFPSLPRFHPRFCQPNPPKPGAALCPAQVAAALASDGGLALGEEGGTGSGVSTCCWRT